MGNLVSLADRSTAEQREISRKGGIASGQARREKADLRRLLEAGLESVPEGQNLTEGQLIVAALINEAKSGSIPAIKEIFDRLYGKAKEVLKAEIDSTSRSEIPEGLPQLYAKMREWKLRDLTQEEVTELVKQLPLEVRLPELTPEQVLEIARMKYED